MTERHFSLVTLNRRGFMTHTISETLYRQILRTVSPFVGDDGGELLLYLPSLKWG